MQQRPLLDLLGARWALAAPVAAAAWDQGGAVAGFALADGTLALAPAHWEGGPQIAQRPGGGIALQPAREPPQPVTRLAVQQGGCRCIAASPGGGFVTGGHDGTLAWTTADGRPRPALPVDTEIVGPVSSLAGAPGGALLAIGHAGGLMLAGSAGPVRLLTGDAAPEALACGPDGSVAAWTAQAGLLFWPAAEAAAIALAGCPGPPGAIAFLDGGRVLVAAGGARPICWRLRPSPGEAEGCGLTGRHRVSAVAGHPRHPLLAAGYVNGTALLCQPVGHEVLFLRAAGGGAITALAWSGDGQRLAIGTDTGEIAVLMLPAALFRAETTA